MLTHISALMENLFVSSTYAKMLEYIARPVIQGSALRLGEEDVRIDSLHGSSGSEYRHRILVKTAKGLEEIFDHVIVTAPVGWLQRHPEIFHPPIPENVSHALNAFIISRLEKAFLRFPEPWWQVPQDSLSAPGKFATSTLFAAPEYAPETNPDKLNQEIFMYSNLDDPDAHSTMLFYLYGSYSQNLTSQLSNHPLDSKEYHEVLTTFPKP
jgi:hypothetical protein